MSKLKVDQLSTTDESVILNVEDLNKSSAIQPEVGTASRSLQAILSDSVNLSNYSGADPTGLNPSDAAFIAAIADANGRYINVNPGTYLLNTTINALNKHFRFNGDVVLTGSGYLQKAIIERISSTTGLTSIGSEGTRNTDGDPHYGANVAFGNTAGNVVGLQIGGANPINGTDGNIFFADGYPSWTSLQSGHYPNPTEFAVQPSTKAGRCTPVVGTNQVTVLSGPGLGADEIGKTVWIKDSGYTVASVAAGSFTVSALGGGSVSFTSNAPHTYVCCYIWGRGKCNVSGTSITRISGDPFVPINNIPTTFVVNGVTTTQASYTSSWGATLAASAGTANNVDYYWWGSVDNLSAAMRLHRVTGAGYEENISLIAFAKGYYHLHSAAGGPDQYPLYLGVGFDSSGNARRSITLDGDNGIVTLGGSYGRSGLEVSYREETSADVNRFRIDSATAGNAPNFYAIGPDTNVNMLLTAKGTGVIQTNSELRANAAVYPNVTSAYSLGRSGNLWSQVWAANGTIQTSDARLKDFEDLSDAELKAGLKLAKLMRKFKWKDKSDDLFHIGILAQEVVSVFAENGLDALEYGLVHYDVENDIYSVSYSELNSLCIAALVNKIGE